MLQDKNNIFQEKYKRTGALKIRKRQNNFNL